MKKSAFIAAAAAFLMLTGCGASDSSGGGTVLPPGNDESISVSSKTDPGKDVISETESKAPALTRDTVTMNRSTGYFYDMISEERLRQASLIMLDGLRNHSESICFDGLNITEKELNELFELVLCCDPELGWVDYNYKVDLYEDRHIFNAYFTYLLTPDKEKAAVEELRAKVREINEGFTGSGDFERLLYFHDHIAENCSYSEDQKSSWTAYGCLIDGQAVCEGYSKALIALCEEAGMLCIPVGGSTDREGYELHMWNKVMMDGEWYNIDVTWDDPSYGGGSSDEEGGDGSDFLRRDYFGFTDEAAILDHCFLETGFLKYPEASATEDNYFIRTGAYIEDPAEASQVFYSFAAQSLDKGETCFQLQCAGSEVYDPVYEAEFSDNGEIFDVLERLNGDGYPVSTSSYRFIPNDVQCILTVIMETET